MLNCAPLAAAAGSGDAMRSDRLHTQSHACAERPAATRFRRCAGRSRGKGRASPEPDVDDLAAVCAHMLSEPLPGAAAPARRLVLIGYSYGSCVAAQALARVPEVRGGAPGGGGGLSLQHPRPGSLIRPPLAMPRFSHAAIRSTTPLPHRLPRAACRQVIAYVSIGYPLGVLSRWFLGSGASWAALAASPLPKLLVIGDVSPWRPFCALEAATAPDPHAGRVPWLAGPA